MNKSIRNLGMKWNTLNKQSTFAREILSSSWSGQKITTNNMSSVVNENLLKKKNKNRKKTSKKKWNFCMIKFELQTFTGRKRERDTNQLKSYNIQFKNYVTTTYLGSYFIKWHNRTSKKSNYLESPFSVQKLSSFLALIFVEMLGWLCKLFC